MHEFNGQTGDVLRSISEPPPGYQKEGEGWTRRDGFSIEEHGGKWLVLIERNRLKTFLASFPTEGLAEQWCRQHTGHERPSGTYEPPRSPETRRKTGGASNGEDD